MCNVFTMLSFILFSSAFCSSAALRQILNESDFAEVEGKATEDHEVPRPSSWEDWKQLLANSEPERIIGIYDSRGAFRGEIRFVTVNVRGGPEAVVVKAEKIPSSAERFRSAGPAEPEREAGNMQVIGESTNIRDVFLAVFAHGKADDNGRDKGRYMIVMEKADLDLESMIEENRKMSLDEKLVVMGRILQAGAELERMEIAHGDIKPGNVFLHKVDFSVRETGGLCLRCLSSATSQPSIDHLQAKMADFAKACSYGEQSYQGMKRCPELMNHGTKIFASPEAWAPPESDGELQAVHDIWSAAQDAWSLGLTLYYLFHSKMPRFHDDPMEFESNPWYERLQGDTDHSEGFFHSFLSNVPNDPDEYLPSESEEFPGVVRSITKGFLTKDPRQRLNATDALKMWR